MLLFSTMLDIKENTMSETDFIRLLIDANQDHDNFKDNIIPKDDISWDGKSLDNRFVHDGLSLSTVKYRNGNIMAARFEKYEQDGKNWATDYVWNITEGRMCIRLDRSFRDDASSAEGKFSPPAFIKYLINNGCLKDDGNIAISSDPINITSTNTDQLINAIDDIASYNLPIVYVSKTFNNEYPVNTSELAKKLRGVAHVFVETDSDLDFDIRKFCKDKDTYDGRVSIYFPQETYDILRLNLHHEHDGNSDEFISVILNAVLQYMNSRTIPPLYTWYDVNIYIEHDRLFHSREERDKALSDSETYVKYGEYRDDAYEELQEEYAKLYKAKEDLKNRIVLLTASDSNRSDKTISLSLGKEKELFTGEITEVVLGAIAKALPSYSGKDGHITRRQEILQAILDNNPCPQTLIEKQKKITEILNGYKGMTNGVAEELGKLGLTLKSHDSHYKFQYYESGHMAILPSTPGSQNSGTMTAREIIKELF